MALHNPIFSLLSRPGLPLFRLFLHFNCYINIVHAYGALCKNAIHMYTVQCSEQGEFICFKHLSFLSVETTQRSFLVTVIHSTILTTCRCPSVDQKSSLLPGVLLPSPRLPLPGVAKQHSTFIFQTNKYFQFHKQKRPYGIYTFILEFFCVI